MSPFLLRCCKNQFFLLTSVRFRTMIRFVYIAGIEIKFGHSLKQFNNLHYELQSVYHEISVKLDISDSAMMILYELCISEGECSFGHLSGCTGMSKQTIS